MPKQKTIFVCCECGATSAKWLGKCPQCGAWNTMAEEVVSVSSGKKNANTVPLAQAVLLKDVHTTDNRRTKIDIHELDRVLGGGIVTGSIILVGGDPGIGKSTLLLQAAKNLSMSQNVLYVSGEEAPNQIKMRADRLDANGDNLYLLCETNIESILQIAGSTRPSVIIIDSIQTVFDDEISSVPGSVTQVRECCARLTRWAKTQGCSVFVVGHVTKEGSIAGPKVLEHMVDCVLYFEGEKSLSYRILRAVKNRYGSTNEIGVFEMKNEGLCEVKNPSHLMLSGRPEGAPGSAVLCCMEGSRPILSEMQALISAAGYGNARRMANGFDYNRMVMLLAVMEKRLGMQLQNHDAYINVPGGLRITETAADLALALAVISAYKNLALPGDLAAVGEIGMTGEIRSVSFIDRRLQELQKMGFRRCIIPHENAKNIQTNDIDVFPAKKLLDVLTILDTVRQEKTDAN